MKNVENDYVANERTLAVLSHVDIQYQTKVIDEDGEFYLNKKPFQLIKESCLEYGSSYDGRREAVRRQLNYTQKVPIGVDPRNNIYVFPTHAPEKFECMWIAYSQVKRLSLSKGKPVIIFKNGQTIQPGISLFTLQKQMQRTAHIMFRF